MNETHTFFKLTRHDAVYILLEDGSFVPEDAGNRHYQQYLAWLAEGNEPEEWNQNATE
jgi:hypothetical protein